MRCCRGVQGEELKETGHPGRVRGLHGVAAVEAPGRTLRGSVSGKGGDGADDGEDEGSEGGEAHGGQGGIFERW